MSASVAFDIPLTFQRAQEHSTLALYFFKELFLFFSMDRYLAENTGDIGSEIVGDSCLFFSAKMEM